MANLEITNNDTSGLIVWEPKYKLNILITTGAVTWVLGTVLGRITASGKLTAYTSGAGDGSEIPVAVLAAEVVFTGAGEINERVLISGEVRQDLLVAHGVGALTVGEVDELRDFTIIAVVTTERFNLDNQ